MFFARTGVQLFGQELLTILPFHTLPWAPTGRAGLGRKAGIALAALGRSILFALVHPSTCGWSRAQTLVALVPVRLALLPPCSATRDVAVSTCVHVLNDGAILGLPMLAAAMAGGEA